MTKFSATLARSTAVAAFVALLAASGSPATAEIRILGVGGFEVSLEVQVAGTPAQAFDAFTGDISGWWDRTYTENPKAIYLEPIPGGRFLEVFDDDGNGALHATVIFAQRGKRIRFNGPMGYSGFPITAIHTVDFVENDANTRVLFMVRTTGQFKEDWPEAVESIWKHFLIARFKPYMEQVIAASQQPQEEPPAQ